MIMKARKEESLPVYGNGKNVRDWIQVTDHCSAIDSVLHKGRLGEVYNIGGETELQNITLVKKILDILNKKHSLIKFVKDRPGHDKRYAIDCSKIKNELGWKPAYNFEEGLKETIQWYIDNEEWVNNCITGEYMEYYQKNYAGKINN